MISGNLVIPSANVKTAQLVYISPYANVIKAIDFIKDECKGEVERGRGPSWYQRRERKGEAESRDVSRCSQKGGQGIGQKRAHIVLI